MLLAQYMPGMEWFLLILLFLAGGTLTALLSLVLRPFARSRMVGRQFSIIAIMIGVTAPLFFLMVLGRGLLPTGYALLGSPAIIGGIAFLTYPRKDGERRGFPVVPTENPDKK